MPIDKEKMCFLLQRLKRKKKSFVLTSQKCRAVVYILGFYKENSREPSGVLTCDKMCAILVKVKGLLTDGLHKYEHIRYLKNWELYEYMHLGQKIRIYLYLDIS